MMCFKRKKTIAITSPYVFLGFGINDYFGDANDLRGCINDINDEINKLGYEFPEFQCLKHLDSRVTTHFFMSEIRRVYKEMDALCKKTGQRGFLYIKYSGHGTQVPSSSEPNNYNEALYLYNGVLIDDNIYKLQQETPDTIDVLAKFDSCFSGDIGSRDLFGNPTYRKARFMPLEGVPILHVPKNRLAKTDSGQKWIIFSAGGEEQTVADATFNGRPNGAFTYADLNSYSRGSLYDKELELTRLFLAANKFDHVPELSGPHEGKTMPK